MNDDFAPYIIIEQWMTDAFPDLEYIHYPIANNMVVIIDDNGWEKIVDKPDIEKCVLFDSNIEEVKVGVTSLWANTTLLESIVTENVRLSPTYSDIFTCIISNNISIKQRIEILQSEDKPKEEFILPIEKNPLFLSPYLTFGEDEVFIDTCCNVEDLEIPLLQFSRKLKRKIIVLCTYNYKINDFDVFNSAFKIFIISEHNRDFASVQINGGAISCLGFLTNSIYIPKQMDKNTSPYIKYDVILKDSFTNVIFSIGNNDEMYIVIPGASALVTFIKEICKRYKSSENFEELDKMYYEKYLKENKKNYINMAKQSSIQIKNELVVKARLLQNEYEILLNSVLEKAKMFNVVQTQIKYFDQQRFDEEQEKKFSENYDMTEALDRVHSIIINPDGIVTVNTKEIYVKDERTGKWHEIGKFSIVIGMISQNYDIRTTVRIRNIKYGDLIAGYQAPHVFSNCLMCHGNIEASIADAYKNKNLYELVLLIIQFLQHANTGDRAGENIDKWPEVPEDVVKGFHKVEIKKIDIPIFIKKEEKS